MEYAVTILTNYADDTEKEEVHNANNVLGVLEIVEFELKAEGDATSLVFTVVPKGR